MSDNPWELKSFDASLPVDVRCERWERLARQLYKALQDSHNDLAGSGWLQPRSPGEVVPKMKAALEAARAATNTNPVP